MASSHKKRTGLRAALIVLLCLVLVCAVAATVLYSLVSRKIKAFQSGASFALDYTITSTEAEPPALYALLDKFGGTTGSLTGQYTPRAVQLALYPTGTSTVNDAPLTRVYISEEETLYDAGQLYNKLRSTVVAEYPLASLLLPGWSLGSYISQDQLAALLGVDPAANPDHRHPPCYLRAAVEGGGHIGQRSLHRDIQGPGVFPQGLSNDKIDPFANGSIFLIFQGAQAPPQHGHVLHTGGLHQEE